MPKKSSVTFTFRINDRVEPIDRGERYEDPLDAFLSKRKLGSVSGGGSSMTATGEIGHVDLEVTLNDSPEVLEDVVRELERLGAPVGSHVDARHRKIKFGVTHMLGLYLDGVNLPDEVYQTCSFEELQRKLKQALRKRKAGEVKGYWVGNTETAIYIYGPDTTAIRGAIHATVADYPLCKNSRVVDIA